MSTNEADPPPLGPIPPAGDAAPPRSSPGARGWALSLGFGLVAGLASWGVAEALHGRLQPRLLSTGGIPTPEEAQAGAAAYRAAVALQMSVAHGSLGAALGLALGLAGALTRTSSRVNPSSGAIGAALGGIFGALTPQALMPIYFRAYDPDSDDFLLAILILGGVGSAVGAAGGASYALGLEGKGRVVRAATGGLLGALAGVVCYVVVGSFAFPLDQMTKPVSATAGSRLVARLIVAVLASAGATLFAWTEPRRAPKA